MPGWGTVVVAMDTQGILLTKREDLQVWCLPGGEIDLGEWVADAAVREAREETGIDVELTGLIGIYFRPNWDTHVVAFAARPVGGTLQPQAGEALDARFFDVDALPAPLMWHHHRMIRDAVAQVGGSAVWFQEAVWPFGPEVRSRDDIYDLRDRSGLTRAEFYARYIENIGPSGETRIV